MPTCWQARRKCRTRFGVRASFLQDPAWAVITAESSSTPPLQSATICRAPCLHYYRRLRNRRGKVEPRGLISFNKEKKNLIFPICCFCSVSRMNVYVLAETSAKPPSLRRNTSHVTQAEALTGSQCVVFFDNTGWWLRDRFIMQNFSPRDPLDSSPLS